MIAFVDVSVVPMDRDTVLQGQTVLIDGGRITALGPTRTIHVPSGAVRIDGRGKFLLPGLADMHAHLFGGTHMAASFGFPIEAPEADSAGAEANLFLWLANGVTTIRNLDYHDQDHGRQALRFRALAAAGQSWMPRIYTAGPWGPLSYFIDSTQRRANSIPSPVLDSVARYVAAYKAAGYDLVKIHNEDPVIVDSVLAAAKRVGIPVVGHVPPPTLVEHVLWGYKSIEHPVYDYLWKGQTQTDQLDTAGIGTLAAAMRRAGVWNCPTQGHYEFKHYFGRYPSILKVLQDSGVKLLVGTDELPWIGVITRELQEFVAEGLTPYQALTAGTRNVAEYFGTLQASGTISVGKRADLLLLTGNPLQDVRYTAQPAGVMLGGRWLSRAEIDSRLAKLTLPTISDGQVQANAPVKGYWTNVLGEAVQTTTLISFGVRLTDSQKQHHQTLMASHKVERQALLDSLGSSDHYQEGTSRILSLLARHLGEARDELTPDQRTTFDERAKKWMAFYTKRGYPAHIPGVSM